MGPRSFWSRGGDGEGMVLLSFPRRLRFLRTRFRSHRGVPRPFVLFRVGMTGRSCTRRAQRRLVSIVRFEVSLCIVGGFHVQVDRDYLRLYPGHAFTSLLNIHMLNATTRLVH